MNHEYIHTFKQLRDDYARLRDGTELFERVNECSSDTDCKSSGSSEDLSNFQNHNYPINLKSTSRYSDIHSLDTVTLARSRSITCPDSGTTQYELRRPRKGHKKSRRGCYNCKKRKVKVYFPFFHLKYV